MNPWEVIGPKEDMTFWKEAEKQRQLNEARQAVIDAAKAAEEDGVICCCMEKGCLECQIAIAVRALWAVEDK